MTRRRPGAAALPIEPVQLILRIVMLDLRTILGRRDPEPVPVVLDLPEPFPLAVELLPQRAEDVRVGVWHGRPVHRKSLLGGCQQYGSHSSYRGSHAPAPHGRLSNRSERTA